MCTFTNLHHGYPQKFTLFDFKTHSWILESYWHFVSAKHIGAYITGQTQIVTIHSYLAHSWRGVDSQGAERCGTSCWTHLKHHTLILGSLYPAGLNSEPQVMPSELTNTNSSWKKSPGKLNPVSALPVRVARYVRIHIYEYIYQWLSCLMFACRS